MLGMTFQNDNSLEWHLKANTPYKVLDSLWTSDILQEIFLIKDS